MFVFFSNGIGIAIAIALSLIAQTVNAQENRFRRSVVNLKTLGACAIHKAGVIGSLTATDKGTRRERLRRDRHGGCGAGDRQRNLSRLSFPKITSARSDDAIRTRLVSR
jgi:hypothetical protein